MRLLFTIILTTIIAVITTLAVTVRQANTTGSPASDDAYVRVMSSGELRCGYALWPPHALVKDPNTGEMSGISYEIVEELGKRLGLRIAWVEETGWGNFIEGLESDRYDMFCSFLWQSAERGRYVDYTTPLFYSTVDVYVRAGDHRFDSQISKLNDPAYTLSIMDGEMTEIIARNHFPKAKVTALPQLAEGAQLLLAVSSGKADAVFTEPSIAKAFLASNPGTLRKANTVPYQAFPNAFGVKLGHYKLRQMINSAVIEMLNHGVIDQIVERYEPDRSVFVPVNRPYQVMP